MTDKCFYSTDGIRTVGPVTVEELKELHRSSQISDFSIFAHESGFQNSYFSWQPVVCLTGHSNRINISDTPCKSQIELLQQYAEAIVSANTLHPTTYEAAVLEFVGNDYFTLKDCALGRAVHYPSRSILSLREWGIAVPYKIHRPVDSTLKRAKEGVLAKLFSANEEEKPPELMKVELNTPLTLELYHNVIYTGGVGIGMNIPVGKIIGSVLPN